MDQFYKLWNFTLFSFGEGGEITFGQAVTVAAFLALALGLAKLLSRLLAQHP